MIKKELILDSIPRLLSLLDRNRFSPTYGCFDRSYWHYKTASDFPCATYQQGVLTLALLYNKKFPGNRYYHRPKILAYALNGMLYWAKIQNRDGSFNEWYPNEHSFVATAFTAYGISESFLLLRNEIPKESKEVIKGALFKAGEWLAKHRDEMVMNHTAGALAALYNLYLLTQEKRFLKAAQKHLRLMEKNQSSEGWFPEYGGADLGYLSLSLDFLAKYYQKSKDPSVWKMLKRALNFMACFLHPDGSYGGEYGNRNTKYLFPHGLEILVKRSKKARYLLNYTSPELFNLNSFDDRYFVFFFLSNYFQAFLEHKDYPREDVRTYQRPFLKTFPESGLVVRRTEDFYLVCNYKKNGVMKIFTNRGKESRLIYSDVGYFARLTNGKIVSSQWLNREPSQDISFLKKERGEKITEIEINSPFVYVNYSLPLAKLMVPFRLFNYTLGGSNLIMKSFNQRLKKGMILRKREAPLILKRRITIKNREVIVADQVSSPKGKFCQEFGLEGNATTIHVPSSRYWRSSDLEISSGVRDDHLLTLLNREASFQLRRSFSFRANMVRTMVKLNDEIIEDKRDRV